MGLLAQTPPRLAAGVDVDAFVARNGTQFLLLLLLLFLAVAALPAAVQLSRLRFSSSVALRRATSCAGGAGAHVHQGNLGLSCQVRLLDTVRKRAACTPTHSLPRPSFETFSRRSLLKLYFKIFGSVCTCPRCVFEHLCSTIKNGCLFLPQK